MKRHLLAFPCQKAFPVLKQGLAELVAEQLGLLASTPGFGPKYIPRAKKDPKNTVIQILMCRESRRILAASLSSIIRYPMRLFMGEYMAR